MTAAEQRRHEQARSHRQAVRQQQRRIEKRLVLLDYMLTNPTYTDRHLTLAKERRRLRAQLDRLANQPPRQQQEIPK